MKLYTVKGHNFKTFIKAANLSMVAFCVLFAAQNQAFSASNFSYSQSTVQSNSNPLQGQVVYVPSGVCAPVVLSNTISSEYTSVGSQVSATLPNALTYNGITVAPKGSVLSGTVIKAKRAGLANKNGQLQVIFNNLRTPQGYNIAVNAVFKTDDNSGILKGGTKIDGAKDYGKNAVVGAGAGAALGTAMGALSGGSVGKGAIYGTAVGAGLGLVKGATNRGDNVEVPANAMLDVYFTQPITVSAPNVYGY